jgi:hypothetical protein
MSRQTPSPPSRAESSRVKPLGPRSLAVTAARVMLLTQYLDTGTQDTEDTPGRHL